MSRRSLSRLVLPVLASLIFTGCSGDDSSESPDKNQPLGPGNYPKEFEDLPPVQEGFTRYVTQPVPLPAGADVTWEEWVAAPMPEDTDIVALVGWQSVGGHHANFYATTKIEPVGTNHEWNNEDQLTTRLLGGVGGEGPSDILALPPGLTYRVAKGSAFMIQTHYVNATRAPIEARTVIDLKLGPVDHTKREANLLTIGPLQFSIPPGASGTAEANCVIPADKNFEVLMMANHMHDWGTSISATLINPDGTSAPLKVDAEWESSFQFHPNWTKRPLESPLIIPGGSTIHTKCEFTNTTTEPLTFPGEMCFFNSIFIGYEGSRDLACVDGVWR